MSKIRNSTSFIRPATMTEAVKKMPTLGTLGEKTRTIGKYRINSLLGEGATSKVYEAFDPDIERRVAIKILHAHLVNGRVGKELLARFKREAISAARCVHPNVVTILEYGQEGDSPFIVMEYVDGISVHGLIKHRLKYGRGISLRRSLSIIAQLLKALHAAHELNIVHRDIKASNVLIVNKLGRIKLADFGMARVTESPDLTMIGSLIGTPRYMAPEIRFGLEADFRADVFSATRLFLELLRLLPASSPVPRSSLPEIADMPPGNRIDYSVVYPTALIPVLIKGLEVDRKKRYQTVLELMQAIKQALPALPQQPKTPPAQVTPVVKETSRETPASADELDSMTSLLADILGPVAAMIMEEHETKSTSANNLAIEISKEIPEQEKQEEFLKRWEAMSLSRRAQIRQNSSNYRSREPGSPPLEGEAQEKTGKDFTHYLGSIAKSMLGQSR